MIPETMDCQQWANAVVIMQERARELLGREQSEPAKETIRSASITINHPRTTFWDWWMWASPSRNVTIHVDNRPSEERDRDQAKWIGMIVAAVAAFAVGVFGGMFCDSWGALQRTQALKDQALLDFSGEEDQSILPALRRFLTTQEAIDQRNYCNARAKLAAAVTLTFGGMSTAMGGFMAASALMTVGYVAMLFGAVGMLGSMGWHWNDDKKNREDATSIFKAADQVRKMFLPQEQYVPHYVQEEGALEPGSTAGAPSAPYAAEEEGELGWS